MQGAPLQRGRDATRNREFLITGSGFQPGHVFIEHCCARLAAGDTEFGDRWTRTTPVEFLREVAEEAADLGAWAALAEQALDTAGLGDDARSDLRDGFLHIIRAGAEAYLLIELLKRQLAGQAVSEAA